MRRYRLNKKRFAKVISLFALMVVIYVLMYVGILYVERNSPMWNYHLMNDIESGDPLAIEYYENVYGKCIVE